MAARTPRYRTTITPAIEAPPEYRKPWERAPALAEILRDRLQGLGPVTISALGLSLGLPSTQIVGWGSTLTKTVTEPLFISVATVDKGPDSHMRRWRPRAMGRATRVQKGVSHIHIELDERT